MSNLTAVVMQIQSELELCVAIAAAAAKPGGEQGEPEQRALGELARLDGNASATVGMESRPLASTPCGGASAGRALAARYAQLARVVAAAKAAANEPEQRVSVAVAAAAKPGGEQDESAVQHAADGEPEQRVSIAVPAEQGGEPAEQEDQIHEEIAAIAKAAADELEQRVAIAATAAAKPGGEQGEPEQRALGELARLDGNSSATAGMES